MAKVVIKLDDWVGYLESRVDVDVYIYGANGETVITLLPKICELEKIDHTEEEAFTNTDRVLTLLQKRLLRGVDIFKIRGEDCSGLAIKFLLENEIIKSDMSANGLWEYIVGTEKKKAHGKKITRSQVQAGDYLFQGSDTNKWHIGYAVDKDYAIESQNHDVGVVLTKIDDRGWKYFARPNWYSDNPEPDKYVLNRELYLTSPMMRGDDVAEVQKHLNELYYNCGEADGVFGKKTDIAVKNFQHDRGLKEDGVVGKKTAEALGFEWGG